MLITSRARRSETAVVESDAPAEGHAPHSGIGEPDSVLRKRRVRFGDDGFGGNDSSRQKHATDGAADELMADPQAADAQPPTGDYPAQEALALLELSEPAMETADEASRATPPPDMGGATEDDTEAPTEEQSTSKVVTRQKQGARRPPAPISPANVAAAVRAGMQSAGLAWLQAADAAGAATSGSEQQRGLVLGIVHRHCSSEQRKLT